jgi:hypothetical protein
LISTTSSTPSSCSSSTVRILPSADAITTKTRTLLLFVLWHTETFLSRRGERP